MSPHPGGGSTPGPPRRPDIQGLRGLAVLLVVVFHAGLPVPGGFTGVDVFFAISGFVITAMLLKDLTSTDRDQSAAVLRSPDQAPRAPHLP